MTKTPFRSIPLENGLTLDLCDASRKVAADRYLVKWTVRITIPLEGMNFGPDAPSGDQMKSLLGDQVVFERNFERNFIDQSEKDAVREALIESFLSSTLTYLSRSDFPKQMALKHYREAMKKRSRPSTT